MYLRYLLMVFLILTISSGFANDKDKEELIKEIAELREKQKLMQDEMDSRIKALEDKLTAKEKTEVTSGFGKIKLDGLQQYRFDVDSQADDTFHMRRLELKFSGSINPSIDWTVMVDPSKTLRLNVSKSGGNVTDVSIDQSTRILQDAFVTWKVSPETRLEVGQQKIPFSLEGLQSSSALDTIDRALFMNVGKLGDIRDTGVQLKSKFNDVELTAAILNGVGEIQNAKDNNQTKVFGGRFVYKPSSLKGLHLGVAGLAGNSAGNSKRERFGAELAYINSDWTLKAEVATGLTGAVRSHGWYAHAGYRFSKNWEGIVRFDAFDPNGSVFGDHEHDTILGFNYYILNHRAKIQFNWVHKQFFGGKPARNQFLLSLQSNW
jgi:hypothetical protein